MTDIEIVKMVDNQDISLRRPGWPRIYTEEEIKECRREQMRHLMNKKTKKSNRPKNSVVSHPRIYTEEEVKQRNRERIQKYYRENKEACLERSRRWHLQRQAAKQMMSAC